MSVYIVALLCGVSFGFGYCQTIFEYGLTTKEQKVVLDAHNNYRKIVANGNLSYAGIPQGTNLKRMKYDDTLAEEAQAIANTTIFAHVSVSDARWNAVGQNLYMSGSTGSGTGSNWAAAVKAWYNEYTIYKYGGCCTAGTGHFTQVIWADTEYVGCGWVFYLGSDSYPYKKLYVCNYGPAGNYIGSYPYKNGTSGCTNLCD